MSDGASTTPLMEQYAGVKAQYPGHLVLFRVGDFYETFGEDARLLSRELEVVLTARAPDGKGERMPMAGVPHHAVESYLGRLVRKGYKVALCDQVEDARFAKGLVRREVTRVVSPGTVVEDRILGGPDHNFLASVVVPRDAPAGYAAVDITTGEWFRGRAPARGLEPLLLVLAPFAPRELLVPATTETEPPTNAWWRSEFAGARIETSPAPLHPEEMPASLSSRPDAAPAEVEAERRLAAYVRAAQPRLLPYLEPVDGAVGHRRLLLDPKTLRHLEIAWPMNPDDPHGATLLSTLDETVTGPGHRTLKFWLMNPLAEIPEIVARQDAVEALVARGAERLVVTRELRGVADLSRIASRLAGRRLQPPELAALRDSLEAVARIRVWVTPSAERGRLHELLGTLDPLDEVRALLRRALPDQLPPSADVGALFRAGYAADLDQLRIEEAAALSDLERLESTEQSASGIRTLKIGYNQVFGYYFEVSRPNLARVPPHFRRKQTISGGERFTSDQLQDVETRLRSAREKLGDAQASGWERFLAEVEQSVPRLHRLSRAVGELDALTCLATVAEERVYVRPVLDESGVIQVRDGRHPILDRLLAGKFVPNDTDVSQEEARLLVLTGPNMSGKSTYMRQVGLLVVLAQAGSFVPARFARFGVVSGLFTRMGFTDEIGRGKSSFMVEMTEVSEILRAADDRSLVLLDEVGRGTSTFDGLAIAWATLKHLHDRVRCRTLLATHYHQLTELVEALPAARNGHLAVRESDGEVAFLHRLVPGSTDRSYGVHVARLAGLPPELLGEAERMLRSLEAEGIPLATGAARRGARTRYTQAILLAEESRTRESELENALRELDPERMTPIEALAWILEARRRLLDPLAPDPS